MLAGAEHQRMQYPFLPSDFLEQSMSPPLELGKQATDFENFVSDNWTAVTLPRPVVPLPRLVALAVTGDASPIIDSQPMTSILFSLEVRLLHVTHINRN